MSVFIYKANVRSAIGLLDDHLRKIINKRLNIKVSKTIHQAFELPLALNCHRIICVVPQNKIYRALILKLSIIISH